MKKVSPTLKRVLESAARLQEVVPDAVLVGGSAAALHAGHRDSFDHDHVLANLVDRYETVLEAVEATEGWATSVRASKPPFTILGRLWGVEAGLRQLRRITPLETVEVIDELPRYKGLEERYHRWDDVDDICQSLPLRLSGVL